MRKSYLVFNALETPEGRKTKAWVVNNTSGHHLGQIEWANGWRKYVFCPTGITQFDAFCLNEITDFLIKATQEQRRR